MPSKSNDSIPHACKHGPLGLYGGRRLSLRRGCDGRWGDCDIGATGIAVVAGSERVLLGKCGVEGSGSAAIARIVVRGKDRWVLVASQA